jgi:hypothetical protein
VALAVGAAACGGRAAREADDRTIVPGERTGPITRVTTLADLRRIYGDASVRVEDVDVGEGETAPGATVFPDDSLRRVQVAFRDSAGTVPRFVTIRGDTSDWHTEAGVTLGTSLERLTRLNGRPFVLLGFGWDYAGTVVSWNGGRLAAGDSGGARFIVRLAPTVEGTAADSLQREVVGDREYPSDHPAMTGLRPAVYELLTIFDQAATSSSGADTDR